MIEHDHFGEIDPAGDPAWSRVVTLHGSEVDATLWGSAAAPLTPDLLDAFAGVLADLPRFDAIARQALLADLAEDREFIDFHLEYVEDLPTLAAVAEAGQVTVPAFVAALRLTQLGLWSDRVVVMDYQVDPDASDQILAVKLDPSGELRAVDWES